METIADKLEAPVEIADGIYNVGTSAPSLLGRNIFLRVFKGSGKNLNMVIDPGPPVDLEPLTANLSSIIGSPSKVHMLFVNHQDPDVGANSVYLSRLNPNVMFLMTEDTWRLVQFYGLNSKKFRAVERFPNKKIKLATGHRLQFIPTPFCHFRGACMVYDLESRILFSGDLLGGIASPAASATEANWTGIKAFHQLYMPSNEALRLAVRRIRELDPAPVMIAPQHGGILSGEIMEDFLNRLNGLRVGLDIIMNVDERIPIIIDAANEILQAARTVLGASTVAQIMKIFHPDGSYPAFFALDANDSVRDIKGDPFEVLESLLRLIFRRCSDEQKSTLQIRFLKICLDRNLPPLDSALTGEDSLDGDIIIAE